MLIKESSLCILEDKRGWVSVDVPRRADMPMYLGPSPVRGRAPAGRLSWRPARPSPTPNSACIEECLPACMGKGNESWPLSERFCVRRAGAVLLAIIINDVTGLTASLCQAAATGDVERALRQDRTGQRQASLPTLMLFSIKYFSLGPV